MANRCNRWLTTLLVFVALVLWLLQVDHQNIVAQQGQTGASQAVTFTPTLINTAIPDATPTATPVTFLLPLVLHQTTLALANGDFEAGPVAWEERSQQHSVLISPQPDLGGIEPHSGQWAVWLGGVDDEVAAISQRFTITAAHPFLHYWLRILSQEEACRTDNFTIFVNGQMVIEQLVLCARNNSDWQARTVDLSRFIGQTVALSLQIGVDANGQTSSVFLDDISLTAEAP